MAKIKEGAIKPATPERAKRDTDLYREYILKMRQDLGELTLEWSKESTTQESLFPVSA